MFTKRFQGLEWDIYSMLLLQTDSADDNQASKKKSRKKKKRKRCEEEEEFPAFKDICSDTEDNRGDHVGTDHQQQRPQTEQTGA